MILQPLDRIEKVEGNVQEKGYTTEEYTELRVGKSDTINQKVREIMKCTSRKTLGARW